MLIKADRSELFREKRKLSERSMYCDGIVDEFVAKKMDCAKLDGYEEHGNCNLVASGLRSRINSRKLDVKVVTRKGVIYLVAGDGE